MQIDNMFNDILKAHLNEDHNASEADAIREVLKDDEQAKQDIIDEYEIEQSKVLSSELANGFF